MRLTKSVDYAMRVLIRLARETGAMTMPVLSEELGISYHHLSKLVQRLRVAGLVRTTQGKHGGVVLAESPEQISLGRVVDLMDGRTQLSVCLDGHESSCQLSGLCKLKSALQRVQETMNLQLEAVKLVELV